MTTWGFHEGELAVQRLAGVEHAAKRLEPMLLPADLSGGAARFLASQTFAVLTGRDRAGRLWTSPVVAEAGFLRALDDVRLRVDAQPRCGDPLHGLPAGQAVGLIAIDFAARRRLRVNGALTMSDDAGLEIRADQAYGNCPKYIHRRRPRVAALTAPVDVRTSSSLGPREAASFAGADTIFLGTTHPTRGSDASHRGGPPGFVHVTSPDQLWFPDFDGNDMFNSFGNLAVDAEAALLAVDVESGLSVHVNGTARVAWDEAGGRRLEVDVAAVVSAAGPA